MLGNAQAYSGFAVKDTARAAAFYRDTLGLDVSERDEGLQITLAGDRPVFVYPKPDHQPATYTILNFPVDDIDKAVEQLGQRGVKFERYDGMEQDEHGIARDPRGPAIAWFTDPDGNIFSVHQGSPFD